uniref:DUF1978 domain-containing protein n=1 Tax=Chlamydia pneumoniae TaxID=83558 RepID=A0A0F7XNX6_CHLPN|nr:Uncharacterized protein BN1224_PB1_B_10950 [Chlamydia pneumoniae]
MQVLLSPQLPPPQHSVGSISSPSKLRVLAITFLVFGMLLLISGALFLTLGIPGLSAAISFGLGIGLSALGGVLMISGLLCLLVKREIPTVRPEEIPEGVSLAPSEEPALQAAQKTLAQLPKELDQLDTDIQEVFACLRKLKDSKYESRSFLNDAKKELRVFDFVVEDTLSEIFELRQIVAQEGWDLNFLINGGRSLMMTAESESLDLFHVSKRLGYLPSGDVRGEGLKKSAKEIVARLMSLHCEIHKVAVAFDRNSYAMAEKAFAKALGALEESVYRSLTQSYRDKFLESERAKIPWNGHITWLRDDAKSGCAEKKLRDAEERWKKFRKAVFWVEEDGGFDINNLLGDWGTVLDPYRQERMDEITFHELYEKTTFLKRLHRKCALAKTTFEKKRSKKNLQAVEEANARRLKYVRDWYDQEFQKAGERLEKLHALYPEVSVSIRENKIQETRSNLEKAYEAIEENYRCCVREQEDYWKEEEKREAEFRERGNKILSPEELESSLEQFDHGLKNFSEKLMELEGHILKLQKEATAEVENKILSDAESRLEIVFEDVKEMPCRIEEIEKTLRMAELPLLPTKKAFEKACSQYNSCAEMLEKVKPYCKESLAYVTSKERLVSLDEDLRRAYTECQKRFQGDSGLESEVRACREQLRERIQEFETQGLDLVEKELLCVSSRLRNTECDCVSGVKKEAPPGKKFYAQYYDEIYRVRVQSRWMTMSERLREGVQACNKMLKAGLSEEDKVLKEEEYWLYREERKNKEKRLVGTKIVATQQRVAAFESIEVPEIPEAPEEKPSLLDKARSLFTREDHT